MAKALIIKGANFNANKLTTVGFDDIPCVGVAWEEDSYTATSIGALNATYTLTPENTTDDVVLSSSDETVVAVVGGVLTVVGVGSCTITVTCGSYSDTATVSVSILYDFKWEFGKAILSASNYIYVSTSTYSCILTSATGDQATTYIAYGAGYSKPVVKLPANTGRVKIKATHTSTFENTTGAQLIWAKDESAGYASVPTAIKAVSAEDAYNIRTYSEKTYTVPSNVNAMAFTVSLLTAATDADAIATTGGLSIEFLPPAT